MLRINAFQKLVYWACCDGVKKILFERSVGLPPNFTGCISCICNPLNISGFALRIAAFVEFAKFRADVVSAPSSNLSVPVGFIPPAG